MEGSYVETVLYYQRKFSLIQEDVDQMKNRLLDMEDRLGKLWQGENAELFLEKLRESRERVQQVSERLDEGQLALHKIRMAAELGGM